MKILQVRKELITKNDDDVVICSAVRTPFTRSKKGGLRDTVPEDLLVAVFEEVVKRAGVEKALVKEVQVGNVLPPGGGATMARMAQLAAGFPQSATVATVNRQCSSSLSAVNHIALKIASGQIDIGIGAGVESMTIGYTTGVMPERISSHLPRYIISGAVLECDAASDCLFPMGIPSENVAAKYSISRERQDEFAAASFQKASAAQKSGKFLAEIIPVYTKVINQSTGEETTIDVKEDDGIRHGVTQETLAKLKPMFLQKGSTHAGNASQVSDGASAVLLARRSVAENLGLPILAKYGLAVVAGVEPKYMGIGPASAIPKLLRKVGLAVEDIDLWEINEAFASQAIASIDILGIPWDKVNPVGGSIALGHPLGATGARQIATALSECKRNGQTLFVTSMCIGTGMGMAALFINEQD